VTLLLPAFSLVFGVLLALLFVQPVRNELGQYLAVAFLAGLDSVLGGVRSGMEQKFRNDVFVTGFISNTLIACFLAWLGDKIFINLFLAVGLVLGSRIFNNLSLIRRYVLTKWTDARERKRLLAQQQTGARSEERTP